MSDYGWQGPPGDCSSTGVIVLECLNRDCENYKMTWDVPGTFETGSFTAVDEDQNYCQECGIAGEECLK